MTTTTQNRMFALEQAMTEAKEAVALSSREATRFISHAVELDVRARQLGINLDVEITWDQQLKALGWTPPSAMG